MENKKSMGFSWRMKASIEFQDDQVFIFLKI